MACLVGTPRRAPAPCPRSAIGFPLGLILIVFCGGDLFTGNCFYSLVAVTEGKPSRAGSGWGAACRSAAPRPPPATHPSGLPRAPPPGGATSEQASAPHPAAGRIPLWGSLRLIVVSWWANLAGSLLMVGLFDGARVWPGRDHYLTHLSEAKCSLGWGTVVVRGERSARV